MFKGIVFTILFSLIGLSQSCFANIGLSVDPIDGSNSLRFDKILPGEGLYKQEIHIRVNSTDASRYQVFQRMLEPMANERGETLNLQAMEAQTLTNSNSAGTLYLQNADHLSMGDQLIYSSAQNGQSDMFTIGYSLNQSLINAGGTFRGRLIFTVRGMGNGASDQVTIDVFLNAASSMKVSVKGAHNPNQVRIKSSDTTQQTADYINVSFSGNSGQKIQIYQEVETMPQSETDAELGADVIQYEPVGETEGLQVSGPTSLRNTRTLIYSSNKEEDSFNLYFLFNADQAQAQEAGRYVSKARYVVETDLGKQEFPIEIKVDILPVFSMNVQTPPGGVSFTHVLVNSPPQDKEVLVTVQSNLHKPYQVFQEYQTSMTNEKGKEFDNKYFTLQVEIPPGQKGQTNYVDFSPMPVGEQLIYSSDSRGSGASFKVLYRLQGYLQMSAGDFSAPIRFSLNQK